MLDESTLERYPFLRKPDSPSVHASPLPSATMGFYTVLMAETPVNSNAVLFSQDLEIAGRLPFLRVSVELLNKKFVLTLGDLFCFGLCARYALKTYEEESNGVPWPRGRTLADVPPPTYYERRYRDEAMRFGFASRYLLSLPLATFSEGT